MLINISMKNDNNNKIQFNSILKKVNHLKIFNHQGSSVFLDFFFFFFWHSHSTHCTWIRNRKFPCFISKQWTH